jgi:putative MATE family efflux protein
MTNQKTAAQSVKDLTEGPIAKKILLFSLPIIASNLLLQLYNAVDSIVIGQYAGSDALAAVGVSNPVMMLFNALFMGFSIGASIIVAQTFGAKNLNRLRRTIDTTFSLAFAIGLAITILGVLLCKPMLSLLNVPDNIIGDASLYLTIIFTGTIGNVFFNYGGGILRGMGDSVWPLISLIISCILNIVLDIWFVYGLGWGVAGVAWATVIGQTLSGLVMAWRISSFGYGVKLSVGGMLRPNASIVKDIFRLGIPSGLQQTAMSLGGVIVQSFTNAFGSLFIAAGTVVMRLDGFLVMALIGFGMAATTFVGQNTGAAKPERVKKGVNVILAIVVSISIVSSVLLFIFGRYFIYVFTPEEQVVEIALQGLRILCFVYVFMGIDITLGGAIRGAGAAVPPMVTTMVNNFLRIPLVYVLAIVPFKYNGVFYSLAISIIVGTLMIAGYYFFGKWRERPKNRLY